MRALEKIVNKSGVDIYNLGTGRGYRVLEMIAAFEKVSGRSIPYTLVDRRPGDIAIYNAGTLKVNKELGYDKRNRRNVRGFMALAKKQFKWMILTQ